MSKQLLKSGLAVALTAMVLALAIPSSAWAHAAVTGTDPEDGANLDDAPSSVSVSFSEIVDPPSTEVAVTGPSGEVLDLPDPEFDGDTITQPMLYTDPGEYTFSYRIISEDGHRVDGTLAFTVAAVSEDLRLGGTEPDAEPTDPATEEPEPTEEPTTDTADLNDDAAAAEDEDNPGVALALILLAVLVVVGGGIALVKIMGRRTKRDDADEDA